MRGAILIAVGAVAIFWGQWDFPRRMRRIKKRMSQRGQPVTRFELTLHSPGYRIVVEAATVAGVVGVVGGIVILSIGE